MKKSILALTVLISLCTASCSLKYRRDKLAENFIPQIVFSQAVLNRYENNKKSLALKTVKFEQYDKSNTVFAQDCDFVLFDEEGKEISTGACALLSADSDSEIYTFYDGISFDNKKQGIAIKGSTIKWNGKTQQLVSAKNSQLTLKKDDFEVTGKNFSASSVSNTFQFSQGVKGQQILTQASSSAEQITFSADSMSGHVSSKSDAGNNTVLSGHAYVKTKTMEIHADSIELSGKDFRYVKANGNIKGVNTESQLEFEASSLEYDREVKIVTLSGDVMLKDIKNAVTAKAQIIEYNQATDVAVMQVGVELTQKNNKCSGAYALYRKKEQTLELAGNAKVAQGTDTFRAQSISFNLETEQIVLDGNVRGTVKNGGN
ncbi:MAG: LPS export ABC transporter periplasmic protein LptC [Treponema sp.]|nr:LPS export ABC transporter periplasmic protein LptC [Treponema sp.]